MLITESSLSLVDGAVSEIINCAAENVGFEYMTGAHNDIASMNLRIESMQVDDMNPSSKYPSSSGCSVRSRPRNVLCCR